VLVIITTSTIVYRLYLDCLQNAIEHMICKCYTQYLIVLHNYLIRNCYGAEIAACFHVYKHFHVQIDQLKLQAL